MIVPFRGIPDNITLVKLLLLGYIAKHRTRDGYCRAGSKRMADEHSFDPDYVRLGLEQLCHDGYLVRGTVKEGEKIIPLKLTEKANAVRVQLFERMFPDIKSTLLSKR